MTADELRKVLSTALFPSKYEVDHETYVNAVMTIVEWLSAKAVEAGDVIDGNLPAVIWFGPSGGLMFKNVELIHDRKTSIDD